MANQKKKFKLSLISKILIGIIAFMALLFVFVTIAINSVTSKDAQTNMESMAKQNAKIITDYVGWAEDTLDYFAYAAQIKEFLEDPNNPEKLKAAQKLTTEYAEDVGELEGLYIANWDSVTLTHSTLETVGVVIREGERLDQLHEALEAAGDEIYNTGILISPSSGKQVVSMYKAIRSDSGKPLGFVGLAVKTEQVLSDLSESSIGGLENAAYDLVNVKDNVYLYTADQSAIGTACMIPDIQRINADIAAGTADPVNGYGVFKDNTGRKLVSVNYYIEEYGWNMFVNAPFSEVYGMGRQLQVFVVIVGILMIALLIVFALFNAHQENINRKLGLQIQKTEATEASLQTAMFKDILTEVQNRVAFSEDLDSVETDADHPCYFAMFDISELAVINTQFGNDAGDAVLCNTAAALTKAFPDGTVYRTGDDEFVVAIKKDDNSTAAYNQVFREVTDAQSELFKPQETPDGMINVGYKIGLVRTTSELSTTVIAVLKDMVNRSGRSAFGQVNFVDMDTM